MRLKIMSFNTQHCLNYITRKIDFPRMAEMIRESGADIIGLNEMRGAGEHPEYTAQTETLAEDLGVNYYFAKAIDVKDKGPYGNGLLSKKPILKAETVMIPDPVTKEKGGRYETRCLLKAEIEGGVTVLVTHMGLHPDERKNAVVTVLEQITETKCVLMGDFNMKPSDPTLSPICNAMQDSLTLFDSAKLSHPSVNPKDRIDFIFVSRDGKVLSADVPEIVASDHRPHTAEVEFL